MTKFTNHAIGARGINLKDGTTRWVEPGETVEIDGAEVKHAHDDFKAPKAEKDSDDDAKKPAATPAPAAQKQEPKA